MSGDCSCRSTPWVRIAARSRSCDVVFALMDYLGSTEIWIATSRHAALAAKGAPRNDDSI